FLITVDMDITLETCLTINLYSLFLLDIDKRSSSPNIVVFKIIFFLKIIAGSIPLKIHPCE
ncbi:TPA: hypothetical protein ACGF54_003622, partial [Vibrio cholerae]